MTERYTDSFPMHPNDSAALKADRNEVSMELWDSAEGYCRVHDSFDCDHLNAAYAKRDDSRWVQLAINEGQWLEGFDLRLTKTIRITARTWGGIKGCTITSSADPAFYVTKSWFKAFKRSDGLKPIVPVMSCHLHHIEV